MDKQAGLMDAIKNLVGLPGAQQGPAQPNPPPEVVKLQRAMPAFSKAMQDVQNAIYALPQPIGQQSNQAVTQFYNSILNNINQYMSASYNKQGQRQKEQENNSNPAFKEQAPVSTQQAPVEAWVRGNCRFAGKKSCP